MIWLDVFGSVCKRFNWRCHAWCLMDNHYHVLLETIEGNLSRGMRQLNGVFTQRSNRRHKRVGHVFQGRYKAIVVQRDAYLLELARYVVLNPVRASMVSDVAEWPWSSFAAMVGKTEIPEWLETDWVLGCFGKRRKSATAKYIDFVRSGIGLEPIWDQMTHPNFLGDESFIDEIGKRYGTKHEGDIKEVSRLERRPLAKSLEWYAKQYADPQQVMAIAYQSGDYTMKQIGEWFGVHYATVSRAVKKYESKT